MVRLPAEGWLTERCPPATSATGGRWWSRRSSGSVLKRMQSVGLSRGVLVASAWRVGQVALAGHAVKEAQCVQTAGRMGRERSAREMKASVRRVASGCRPDRAPPRRQRQGGRWRRRGNGDPNRRLVTVWSGRCRGREGPSGRLITVWSGCCRGREERKLGSLGAALSEAGGIISRAGRRHQAGDGGGKGGTAPEEDGGRYAVVRVHTVWSE